MVAKVNKCTKLDEGLIIFPYIVYNAKKKESCVDALTMTQIYACIAVYLQVW